MIQSSRSSSSCYWDFLPEEIQLSILLQIPAWDLVQLRRVSKSWMKLISKFCSDRELSYSHFNHHRYDNRSSLLIQLQDYDRRGCHEYYFSLQMKGDLPYRLLPLKAPKFAGRNNRLHVQASCDGLLLMSEYIRSMTNPDPPRRLFLWNPLTEFTAILPDAPLSGRNCIDIEYLGMSSVSERDSSCAWNRKVKYKIAGILYYKIADPLRYDLLVFTIGAAGASSLSWRLIELELEQQAYFNCESGCGVVAANDRLNWIALYESGLGASLISLDLSSEVVMLTTINMPCGSDHEPYLAGFFAVNKTLHLLRYDALHNIEVWTMRNWDSMSWVQEHVVPTQKPRCRFIKPIAFTPDGSKIITLMNNKKNVKFFSYDIDTHEVNALSLDDSHDHRLCDDIFGSFPSDSSHYPYMKSCRAYIESFVSWI